MRKLFSSILAEVHPLWLKPRRDGLGSAIERPEQLEDIIRANPWVPFRKHDAARFAERDAAAKASSGTRGAQTRH